MNIAIHEGNYVVVLTPMVVGWLLCLIGMCIGLLCRWCYYEGQRDVIAWANKQENKNV